MAIFLKDILSKAFFTFLRLILTAIFIASSPLILGVYLVLCLYRVVISKVARHFDPSLGKLVSSISNFFAAHEIYENSFTINIALHVVGKIDKHHLIHGLEKFLGENRNSDGTMKYPEMTQRIVKRFGYTFWQNVDNFLAENHVKYLNESDPDAPLTLEGVRRTIAGFGKTPLDPNCSPWVVYVVRNFMNERNPSVRSAIIVRLHHCMFDGYSVLNVFGKMADNPLVLAGQAEAEAKAKAEMESEGWKGWVLRVLLRPVIMVFRGPYELVGQLLSYDNNELVQRSKRDFKSVMRFHECDPVPLEDLKRVKNHFGVTMTTLITTLNVRALKKFMEKRGIAEKKVQMTFPLPVLNRPDKLRNYFSGGIISFNFSHDDRVQLLRDVEKKFFQFRYAFMLGLPEASMLLLRILGSLPCILVPKVDKVPLSSTLMQSSFPGPIDLGYYCGFPIVDATVAGSISRPYPVGNLSYSYHGWYKFGWMGDASVLPTQEDVEELGDNVMKELKEFQKLVEEETV